MDLLWASSGYSGLLCWSTWLSRYLSRKGVAYHNFGARYLLLSSCVEPPISLRSTRPPNAAQAAARNLPRRAKAALPSEKRIPGWPSRPLVLGVERLSRRLKGRKLQSAVAQELHPGPQRDPCSPPLAWQL